jgi:hypothetical protein
LSEGTVAAGTGADPLGELLALPDDARPAFVVAHLCRALAAVLRAEESSLDPSAPLAGFGVDSLMAFEFKLRVDREFRTNVPVERLSAGATLAELAALLLRQLTAAPVGAVEATAPVAASAPPPIPAAVSGRDYLRVLNRESANGELEGLTFDAAALLYVPDRVSTVGGVADAQLPELFGAEPFVSHLYETAFGRIGVITLPVRGKELFGSARLAGLVRRAGELARRKGARRLSLTGLIPSATDYGRAVCDWIGAGPRVTTGHATTTAAVVLNLQNMLDRVGRYPGWEHLAVLGLGSIGRSCLALALDSSPHPRALTLCDVFAKRNEVEAFARDLRERHGYRGPVRVLASDRGLPEGLYEATTILTAVSVPEVLDVARLRSGTVVVDDSYPPAFSLERAVGRADADADLFFSNAGMVRLRDPIRETVFLPPGAGPFVARFGEGAFLQELARDPHELTACILSALLTDRHEGFSATVGLPELTDLQSHSRGLQRLGITAARPQCGTYFMPDGVVDRFRERFTARPARPTPSGRRGATELTEGA